MFVLPALAVMLGLERVTPRWRGLALGMCVAQEVGRSSRRVGVGDESTTRGHIMINEYCHVVADRLSRFSSVRSEVTT
jgi:hypothetical protein